MDCSTALTVKPSFQTANNDLTLPYVSGPSEYSWTLSYSNVFDNANAVQCPVSLCELKASDCLSTIVASSHVSMPTGSHPWAVTAQ